MNRLTGLLRVLFISIALFATPALADIKTVTLSVSGMT
jgi:hypothetical protein